VRFGEKRRHELHHAGKLIAFKIKGNLIPTKGWKIPNQVRWKVSKPPDSAEGGSTIKAGKLYCNKRGGIKLDERGTDVTILKEEREQEKKKNNT